MADQNEIYSKIFVSTHCYYPIVINKYLYLSLSTINYVYMITISVMCMDLNLIERTIILIIKFKFSKS